MNGKCPGKEGKEERGWEGRKRRLLGRKREAIGNGKVQMEKRKGDGESVKPGRKIKKRKTDEWN